MSDLAGEVAGAILILFVGAGILLTLNASLYGGEVSRITSLMSSLAMPVALLAILAFFAVAILDSL